MPMSLIVKKYMIQDAADKMSSDADLQKTEQKSKTASIFPSIYKHR